MITAILIDDHEKSRISLKDALIRYCPEVKIIGEEDSVKSGIRAIKVLQPQLIFLDIELTDGYGFDVVAHFLDSSKGENTFKSKVIFVSSHQEYAIKAFKFSAVDYLLKPVDSDDLIKAVQKIKNELAIIDSFTLQSLLNNIKSPQRLKITLPSAESIAVVEIKDIVRCEGKDNYTIFYLANKQKIVVSQTLKEYEGLLKEFRFERVHKSHLVNLDFVSKYLKNDGGSLLLKDNSMIPVSPNKKENLLLMLSSL